MKREKPNGFTLLELLVAAALIAVAATVIASAFAAGFRVWQRASAKGDDDAVLALELMQKDLCNTVPLRLVPFRGSESRVEFPSLLVSPEGPGRQEQPGTIRYEFNATLRTLDRVMRSLPLPEAEQERRETLMESVESLRFSYWESGSEGGGKWEREWNGRTNTPGAVKVEFEFQQGDERIDRVRTIIMPCR